MEGRKGRLSFVPLLGPLCGLELLEGVRMASLRLSNRPGWQVAEPEFRLP